MKPRKCELCSADWAVPDGRLCAACREAIVRLLVIREEERTERGENDNLEQVVVYPEQTKSNRQAGS